MPRTRAHLRAMPDPSPIRDRLRLYDSPPPLAPSATLGTPLVPGCIGGLRGALVTLAGLIAVLLIAWLDSITGPDLSLSLFYLIPIAACAWWGGFAHAILLSLAGAVAWYMVDAGHRPEMLPAIGLWNGIVRAGMLVIVSSLVARLHVGILRERLLARTDALTGAANGRTFYESIAAEAERATRNGRPLTMAYLDLDNFKQLNDKHGHAAGDAALVDLVRVIAPSLRGADVLARLGGDEFAILLPETDAAGAVALLTRIQDLLAFEMARAGRPITVSIGAVTFVKPLWDVDLMVQQVDGLMYSAKRRGKNRVEHVTIRDARDLRAGHPPRLERRATARTLCNHAARVRPDGDQTDELFATVHDLAPAGVGLRLGREFPLDSVLIVEPLAYQAKTLLARVVRVENAGEDQWLHGCVLSTELSTDELECWLSGIVLNPPDAQPRV